ncbi:MAG: alpha/beta fold hydrolase [Pseudomonadota bacterium]
MASPDPCIIDTLPFSGLDPEEMCRRALESRSDIDLFEHELSFVRRRVIRNAAELPSLIILPDGPATLESYDGFIDALSDRFNIAILEIPGFGFSWAKDTRAMEFETCCQIMAQAIADLDLPQTVLVGPCIQGLIAARIAEILGDQLAGLIIAQTADFAGEVAWTKSGIDTHGNLVKPFEGQVSFRLARERATVDWWAAFVAGPKLPLEEFQEEARKVLRCGCSYALASQIQKFGAMEELPEFAPQVPTAVIWGLSDQSHQATDKRSVLRYAPDAIYIERDDLGHFPDLEEPELIAEIAEQLVGGA